MHVSRRAGEQVLYLPQPLNTDGVHNRTVTDIVETNVVDVEVEVDTDVMVVVM